MTHEKEGVADEAAEALGQMIGELFAAITEAMRSQETMREVQSVLILRLGEAVLDLQMSAGRHAQAQKLGEVFGMAAAVLNANNNNTEGESK